MRQFIDRVALGARVNLAYNVVVVEELTSSVYAETVLKFVSKLEVFIFKRPLIREKDECVTEESNRSDPPRSE